MRPAVQITEEMEKTIRENRGTMKARVLAEYVGVGLATFYAILRKLDIPIRECQGTRRVKK